MYVFIPFSARRRRRRSGFKQETWLPGLQTGNRLDLKTDVDRAWFLAKADMETQMG